MRVPTEVADLGCLRLAWTYLDAKRYVLLSGCAEEVAWQNAVDFEGLTETGFLRETAWVILNSGMRESVIRHLFADVSRAFLDWKSAQWIHANHERCASTALRCFKHKPKITAILDIVSHVARLGFQTVMENVRREGIAYMLRFPYIGPATSLHLAKNIGLHTAKPDRHLCRMAGAVGCESPQAMCEHIAWMTGDSVPVVDLVLWRFATLRGDYLDVFASAIHAPPDCVHSASPRGQRAVFLQSQGFEARSMPMVV